jgi:hypothetical protein
MIDNTFGQVFTSQWEVIAFVSVALLVSAEVGFLFGLRLHRAKDEAGKGQIGGTQGAILGLLGLLLGFTFAMSVNRYDSRRELMLQEANSIGTTYLRAALLPESHQQAVENLLRQYVDVRLDFFYAGENRAKQDAAEQAAAKIQKDLWSHAVAAARESPSPVTVSFITALNDTIDMDATRLMSLRAHVPGAVWLLVVAVAACGCAASGYSAGSSGARSSLTNLALPLLIAVVITLIADLDRSRSGLITVSQQPLIDLKQSLQPNQP